MVKLYKVTSPVLLISFSVINPLYAASDQDPDFGIQAKQLKSQFTTAPDGKSLTAAKFNSGLAFAFNHQLVDLALDYTLQGDLTHYEQSEASELSQIVNGSLRSLEFNDLFKVDAVIRANSLVKEDGEIYQHTFISEFNKPVYDLANLNIRYSYGLNKPSPIELEQQVMGYSLGLEGKLVDGRLSWQSGYGESSVENEELFRENTTKELNFGSRYLIVPDMHLDLSGMLKRQSLPEGGEDFSFDEKRYGAGLYWSPTEEYAISLKLNKLDESRYGRTEYFSSGTISWVPRPLWQVELSYDDHLVEGVRGLMLRTKVDLDKS